METGPRPVVGLVEDSDEDYAQFARVFREEWDLLRWRTGEEALQAFIGRTQSLAELSVLVVDLHLSGIAGVDVIRKVRELPDGKTLPVCLLTGSRLEEDRRASLDVGVDAFLVKPDDADRLRELPRMLAKLAAER